MRRILSLARRLRRDCPWDRSQTPASFKKCVLEEVKEIGRAIDARDRRNLAEEIGDTLWNMAFLVVMAEEKGWFGYERVVAGLLRKMVRRHPHVFGKTRARTPAEALATFNRVKARERRGRPRRRTAATP